MRHCHQQIFGDLGTLQHDSHEHEKRDRDKRVPFDFPVDAAEISNAGTKPLHRIALVEIGGRIAFNQRAGEGGKPDRQNGGSRQGERHRVAGGQRPGHHQHENGYKEKFHAASSGLGVGTAFALQKGGGAQKAGGKLDQH